MKTRCSKCKHGRHKLHEAKFTDKDGVERDCKCKVCVPAERDPH